MDRDGVKVKVQQATDLVRLIGEHVRLTARGREFIGLCPFHDDHRPSMHVVPAKQLYKCFSCGAGGDAFSFVMDFHKKSFPEALQYLADRAGIELPNSSRGDEAQGPSQRKQILEANKLAIEFFRLMFQHEQQGAAARQYVGKRGISEAMLGAFAVGYAPDGWEGLTHHIRARRWSADAFAAAGLITERKNADGHYDRLRHRLIFPIFDAIGQPIAFGGRKLRDEDEPKYLNSPETILFNKSATLYGLHLAQRPIVSGRTAIIVEGYTDVIACHQAGVTNAVATLGTALTRQHAQVLKRYCDRVILVFDADDAGQKAADRALEVFFNEPLDVDIAILPDGLDPADLLAKDEGLTRWEQAMDAAIDAMSFQFQRMRRLYDQTASLSGKQRIAEDYLQRLVQLGFRQLAAARRGLVAARLAELLKLDLPTIEAMIRRLTGAPRPAARPAHDEPMPDAADAELAPAEPDLPNSTKARRLAERQLIGCVINQPRLFHALMPDGRPLCESVAADDFDNALLGRVYAAVSEHLFEADCEQMPVIDLRAAIEDEALLREALNLKFEVDRMTVAAEGDSTAALPGVQEARIGQMLIAAVRSMAADEAERRYTQQKMQWRAEAQSQDDAAATATAEELENQRLWMAVAHAKANPSAKRGPRIRH